MTAFEVEIDVVSLEDAQAVLEYAKRVGEETDYLSFGSEGLGHTVEQEILYIHSVLDPETTQMMLVAKLKGEIIAVASIGGNNRSKFHHVGEIGISVLQEYWGQGLASHLMEELLNWARDYSPLTRLELEVVDTNQRAIQLYEKFGFTYESTAKNAIRLADGYHDLITMVLFLEEE